MRLLPPFRGKLTVEWRVLAFLESSYVYLRLRMDTIHLPNAILVAR
jgi:hypothetical protein